MKILFVCGAGYIAGKEIITLSLIEGLRARGHEVRCLTSTWGSKEFGKRLEASQTPYARIPLGFISKTLSWPAIRMTLHQMLKMPRLLSDYKTYLRDFRPDVVIHSNFHYAFLLWPLLDARNTLFHVHDPISQTNFYRRLFRFLNRRLYAFIGVSGFIKNMLVQLGVPEEKVFFVLNGIDLADDEETWRGEAGAASTSKMQMDANGAVKIGIVGQIGEWKGHNDFIEALHGLKQSDLPFNGIIFGEGDPQYVASLKAKISDYELARHIRWAGFVKDTREIFAATDICIIPSRSQDPCPTVAIEAAHCGVPLIATRQGGLPELVRDGETGYLVDAGAPEQITEKLKLLIGDADLRRRMAQAAKRHGLEHLTRERMVRQMEAIFTQMRRRNADVR